MYQHDLQCWGVLFLSFFSFFFFLIHTICQCHLLEVSSCVSPIVFSLSNCPFVGILPSSTLRMVLYILNGWLLWCLSLSCDSCISAWFRQDFLFVRDTILFFWFFHTHLLDDVYFQYSQDTRDFLVLQTF